MESCPGEINKLHNAGMEGVHSSRAQFIRMGMVGLVTVKHAMLEYSRQS